MKSTSQLLSYALLAGAVSLSPMDAHRVDAGCKCQGNAVGGAPVEVMNGAPLVADPGFMHAPMAAPVGIGPVVAPGVAPGMTEAPVPPPGTIGRTYQLRSRSVHTTKHPRAGMIDVYVTGATNVIVHDINEYRTEDKLEGYRSAHDPNLYHFLSEPLVTGIPHIYRVEVHTDGPNGPDVREQFVRLIRGRIVELRF